MFITDETVTTLKEVTQFIPNLDYIDLASLLAAIAESIRQGQSLGDSLEESNIDIEGITDDGCGLLPHIKDISIDKPRNFLHRTLDASLSLHLEISIATVIWLQC